MSARLSATKRVIAALGCVLAVSCSPSNEVTSASETGAAGIAGAGQPGGASGGASNDSGVTEPGGSGGHSEDASVAYDATMPPDDAGDDIGTPLGAMWNTYYYVTFETDFAGPDAATIFDAQCNPLAQVPQGFFDSLCIEGSGKLSDGRVLGYAGDCACADPCSAFDHGKKCWVALDAGFPWGMGSTGNAIEPLRSWAVDNSFLAPGTVVYAKQWDGVAIPSVDGLGGFVHDGCFRADDTGGPVQGNHYDFFAGTHGMWDALEGVFETGTHFDVYTNPGKCAYLKK